MMNKFMFSNEWDKDPTTPNVGTNNFEYLDDNSTNNLEEPSEATPNGLEAKDLRQAMNTINKIAAQIAEISLDDFNKLSIEQKAKYIRLAKSKFKES